MTRMTRMSQMKKEMGEAARLRPGREGRAPASRDVGMKWDMAEHVPPFDPWSNHGFRAPADLNYWSPVFPKRPIPTSPWRLEIVTVPSL
jgi:hypothetical protein